MAYYLGVDIGTSGTKTILVNTDGGILAEANASYPLLHPRPMWSEQDPEHWWKATVKTVRSVVRKSGVKKEEVERGQVLAKPASITPHSKFESEIYILTKEEGGRHKPFFTGYRPQFYFRTTDVTGTIDLADGVEMVMPGDNVKVTVTLITPVAMDEQLHFAIREGGRTVGAGVVAKIVE